jgi:D-arginine dehydrogenase
MSPSEPQQVDVAIVGAGIVGASIAWHLAPHRRVLLLEAEAAPGSHSTGRSAALFTETYGPPQVRALTRASRAFFDAPPAGFSPVPLLAPRGTLIVGTEDQRAQAQALLATLRAEGAAAEWLEGEAARARVPVLRPEAAALAVFDPGAFDIEVDALLQGFLRGARAHGAVLRTQARLERAIRSTTADATCSTDAWLLHTADGATWHAATLVNAAGAWADAVAALAGAAPAGIEPRRRSAFLFEPPADTDIHTWPAVLALDERWYFKPDAGLLLGSPANADPVHAHDVVAEELDVAIGMHRIEQATTLTIRRPRSTWAGLRCFAADGEPVCGFDPATPGFFWAAALGGYGIQSSPALGRLAAALLRGDAVPDDIAAQGLDAAALAPGRASLHAAASRA